MFLLLPSCVTGSRFASLFSYCATHISHRLVSISGSESENHAVLFINHSLLKVQLKSAVQMPISFSLWRFVCCEMMNKSIRCFGTDIKVKRDKIVPAIFKASTTPGRRIGEWKYNSTHSWPRH
jgi:hypothetical protein